MNFKQIIKEEIDDMGWIENVRSNPVVSGTLVFVGNTTNTKNRVKIKPNSYHIIKLTVDYDSEPNQMVRYDSVISNSWTHFNEGHHDPISVEWANHLFSTNYWRVVSENVPKGMLVPTSNNKKSDIPADDWEPYIVDVSTLFNQFDKLNESDIKWIEDEMSLSTVVWDKNKSYVLDVSELPNSPPRFSHNPNLFKSDIVSYAKEMGYDTNVTALRWEGAEVCYIYFELGIMPTLSWDWCDIPDPTYGGKYEMISVDTFLFLMENKLIK